MECSTTGISAHADDGGATSSEATEPGNKAIATHRKKGKENVGDEVKRRLLPPTLFVGPEHRGNKKRHPTSRAPPSPPSLLPLTSKKLRLDSIPGGSRSPVLVAPVPISSVSPPVMPPVISPDLFDDSTCFNFPPMPPSHRPQREQRFRTENIGSDSDDDVLFTGEVSKSKRRQQSSGKRPVGSSSPSGTKKGKKSSTLSYGRRDSDNGFPPRSPLQKSPRCQLFPNAERDFVPASSLLRASSSQRSSNSTLDQEFESVGLVRPAGYHNHLNHHKYNHHNSYHRRSQTYHSKRSVTSPSRQAGTSRRNIPSPNGSEPTTPTRNPRTSTSRRHHHHPRHHHLQQLDPDVFDCEISDDDDDGRRHRPLFVSVASGSRSAPLPSPDPVQRVQQMEEDELLAQRLQAQFDAELREADATTTGHGNPSTLSPSPRGISRRARVGSRRHHAGAARSPTQGIPESGRHRPPPHHATPRLAMWDPPVALNVDLFFGGDSAFLMDAMEDRDWNMLNIAEMLAVVGFPETRPRRLSRGRPIRGRYRPDPRMGTAAFDGNDYEELWELAETLGSATRAGLTKAEIGRLPTRVHGGGGADEACANSSGATECHICMSNYERGDRLRILTCFHDFHAHCIDRWLKDNNTCPVCRAKVVLQQDV